MERVDWGEHGETDLGGTPLDGTGNGTAAAPRFLGYAPLPHPEPLQIAVAREPLAPALKKIRNGNILIGLGMLGLLAAYALLLKAFENFMLDEAGTATQQIACLAFPVVGLIATGLTYGGAFYILMGGIKLMKTPELLAPPVADPGRDLRRGAILSMIYGGTTYFSPFLYYILILVAGGLRDGLDNDSLKATILFGAVLMVHQVLFQVANWYLMKPFATEGERYLGLISYFIPLVGYAGVAIAGFSIEDPWTGLALSALVPLYFVP
jgi:hypothetical protein